MSQTKAVVIATPIEGDVQESNFTIKEIPLPPLDENKVHLKVLHASVDPYLRGALEKFKPGDVIANFCVAEVIDSKHPDYKKGDYIQSIIPIQAEVVMEPKNFYKIDSSLNFPLSTYIGALGMPCQTAYGVLFCDERLPLKQGGVMLVSGAAGMVGSAVGQLGRLRGASKIVGIAGGEDKCKLAKEKFGYDECVDYKKFNGDSEALRKALMEVSPEGYDYYYDNVGGFISAAVWPILNDDANVAICGQIAHYNEKKPSKLDAWLYGIIYKTITVKGVLVWKYAQKPGFYENFYKTLVPLMQEGKFHTEETVLHGIEEVPHAFVGLFKGLNKGKMVITF